MKYKCDIHKNVLSSLTNVFRTHSPNNVLTRGGGGGGGLLRRPKPQGGGGGGGGGLLRRPKPQTPQGQLVTKLETFLQNNSWEVTQRVPKEGLRAETS